MEDCSARHQSDARHVPAATEELSSRTVMDTIRLRCGFSSVLEPSMTIMTVVKVRPSLFSRVKFPQVNFELRHFRLDNFI